MAFHQVAVPHRDILSKNFSSEVYAAKLWDVHKKRGSDEYADSTMFFEKTYLTNNLSRILDSVKERLDGKSGGHFRSISTPFGGGKTHTLIALYHKCMEWGVKPVVLVGNELDPNTQTLWGAIEEQLTGRIDRLGGQVPHGGEELRKILVEQNEPILILIDELLQYITKADGIKVNETTLAEQTILFIQELGEAVSSLANVCVVVTLPSSANEQLDNERFAELYEKLKKFAGRTKDTITPVSDQDIPKIIRQRLFSTPDGEIRERAEGIVKDFVDYCNDEGLIPEGMHASQYRERFMDSYPFLPQVIDVLYQRWGTITQFQRTRGVLRLLSLVINSLATSDKQFISLGDFDLGNDEIRQELLDYLDPQFNSVIAKDIVGDRSGSSKVNRMVPDQFRGNMLGIRAATAIFMYSHSGGAEINGATEVEVKRATCTRGIPAAQIGGVLNLFRNHLFYMGVPHGRYLFTKEANILKIKVDIMENLKPRDVSEAEKILVKRHLGKTPNMRIVLWPTSSKDVENSPSLKLIIMQKDDPNLIQSIYETVGETPRRYRNNVFFLVPSEGERVKFMDSLKSKISWETIRGDPSIKLKEEQAATLANELKMENGRLDSLVRDYYSILHVPEEEGLSRRIIRFPPVTDSSIDALVYENLAEDGIINPEIGVAFLKRRYLHDREFVETSNIFEAMLSVPGERRPTNKDVIRSAIMQGVIRGEFGLGDLENDVPVLKFYKEPPVVSFELGEILLPAPHEEHSCGECGYIAGSTEELRTHVQENHEHSCGECGYIAGSTEELRTHVQENHEHSCGECGYIAGSTEELRTHVKEHDMPQKPLTFTFKVPEGQVNHISPMLLKISSHYKILKLTVDASDGTMSKHDIEMIKETLLQIGADTDLS